MDKQPLTLDATTSFLCDALRTQGAVILCLLPPHLQRLQMDLMALGFDIDAALNDGSLVLLDSSFLGLAAARSRSLDQDPQEPTLPISIPAAAGNRGSTSPSSLSVRSSQSTLSPVSALAPLRLIDRWRSGAVVHVPVPVTSTSAGGDSMAEALADVFSWDMTLPSIVREAIASFDIVHVVTDLGDESNKPVNPAPWGIGIRIRKCERLPEAMEMSFEVRDFPLVKAQFDFNASFQGGLRDPAEYSDSSSDKDFPERCDVDADSNDSEPGPSRSSSAPSVGSSRKKRQRHASGADGKLPSVPLDQADGTRLNDPSETLINSSLDALTTRSSLIDALSELSTGFLCISFPLTPCVDTDAHQHGELEHSLPVSGETRLRFAGKDVGITATPSLYSIIGLSEGENLADLGWVERCIHGDDRDKLVDFIFDKSQPEGSDGSVGVPNSGSVVETSIALVRVVKESSHASTERDTSRTFVVAVRVVRREWDGSRRHWVSTFAFLPLESFQCSTKASLISASSISFPEGTATGPTPPGYRARSGSLSYESCSIEGLNVHSAEEDANLACRESERFARVIGRELRDPLTGIMGCVGLLEQSLSERSRLYSLLESAFFRAKRAVTSAAASVEAANNPSARGSPYPSPSLEPMGLNFDGEDGPSSSLNSSSTSVPTSSSRFKRQRKESSDRPYSLIESFRSYLEEDMMSIAAIAECVDRSRSVIDDVLDLSRMDANRMRLFPKRFDPKRILTDVARRLAPRAQDRGVSLRMNLPVDDIWIAADPARFDQAVTNLVNFSIQRACASTPVGDEEHGVVSCQQITTEDVVAEAAYPAPALQALGFERYYLDENGHHARPPMPLVGMPGMSFGTTMTSSSGTFFQPSTPTPPPPRIVTVGLDASLSVEGSLWVTVTSQDNGPTLSAEEESGLFDRSSIVRNYPASASGNAASMNPFDDKTTDSLPEAWSIGPALGLLLSKRLVELMGGTIRACPGPVSRFRTSLSSSPRESEMEEGGVMVLGTGGGEIDDWRGALLSLTIPSAPKAPTPSSASPLLKNSELLYPSVGLGHEGFLGNEEVTV
ncbi:hypothetical protein HDU67_000525 [Dinochytrium kinnereticum]|nr:hypothetical protein HDU67_000525 [Dinochytrium kinnereticum]